MHRQRSWQILRRLRSDHVLESRDIGYTYRVAQKSGACTLYVDRKSCKLTVFTNTDNFLDSSQCFLIRVVVYMTAVCLFLLNIERMNEWMEATGLVHCNEGWSWWTLEHFAAIIEANRFQHCPTARPIPKSLFMHHPVHYLLDMDQQIPIQSQQLSPHKDCSPILGYIIMFAVCCCYRLCGKQMFAYVQ